MVPTVPTDFTFDAYRMLLDSLSAAGYETLTVREYLACDELPECFVINRHDVDRKPQNSLTMAEIEADRGVQSTYYVRTTDEVFRPDIIRRLEALGHEVGYHYEAVDRAGGDLQRAKEVFERNLEMVRSLVPVDTVCMHGNPLTPHDNRDLWDAADLSDFDLLGEAYLSMNFEDVVYFSDTGRTWRDGALKVKDHTMGEGDKRVQADTTHELAGLFRDHRLSRACVLSHPNRWAGDYVELVVEQTKDTATNIVKHGINHFS
ncbi:hypothetical protein [Haloarchaeobius sp. HRN-SO-5]|uniref:hypothetical protein n=1 Tax=Haloarchaeobius sp. HRN-SO-5 TaxID=3446118 RepID=UPI003EBC7448